MVQIAKEMLHTNFDTSAKFADSNSCSKYFNPYDKVSYMFLIFPTSRYHIYFFFFNELILFSTKKLSSTILSHLFFCCRVLLVSWTVKTVSCVLWTIRFQSWTMTTLTYKFWPPVLRSTITNSYWLNRYPIFFLSYFWLPEEWHSRRM